jgi:hypothetical protein
MPGMRKKNEKKTPLIRRVLPLNLNTINLFEISSLTQRIREKVVTRQLKLGTKSKSFLGGINMDHQIHIDYVNHIEKVEYLISGCSKNQDHFLIRVEVNENEREVMDK